MSYVESLLTSLKNYGKISEIDLNNALQIYQNNQQEKGIGEILVDKNVIDEVELALAWKTEGSLDEKIKSGQAKVGVIGLGYVGLPLVTAVAETGFPAWGVDVDSEKIERIKEKGVNAYSPSANSRELFATTDYSVLQHMDVINICVPTPLNQNREPDLSYLGSAMKGVAENLAEASHKQLIILHSTSFPGTTEEVVLTQLEKTGSELGKDFHLAFSPERMDPGNEEFGLKNTPKVVAGVTRECTELAVKFFDQFIDQIIPVSSPKVAEMEKLLENVFRNVNIALVNELRILCDRMDIDIWEALEAASTKPFGFMPFYPGPGVGGDCIPTDPFYLSWKAREYGFSPKITETAAEINWNVPHYVTNKIIEALNNYGKVPSESNILLLGISFKKNVGDIRNSPSVEIAKLLRKRGVNIAYNDEYVPKVRLEGDELESLPLNGDVLRKHDATVILTDHSYYQMAAIVENSQLVIDTRNATKDLGTRDNIVRV